MPVSTAGGPGPGACRADEVDAVGILQAGPCHLFHRASPPYQSMRGIAGAFAHLRPLFKGAIEVVDAAEVHDADIVGAGDGVPDPAVVVTKDAAADRGEKDGWRAPRCGGQQNRLIGGLEDEPGEDLPEVYRGNGIVTAKRQG